jgi:hypothetical protein
MRVSNDQDTPTALLGKVETGDEVSWAVDLIGCGRPAPPTPPWDAP